MELAGGMLVVGLLPFPDFGDGCAGGVDFEFEGSAGVVEVGEFLRSGFVEEHAAITDGSSLTEFAEARALPGDAVAVLGGEDSLAVTLNRQIGCDDRGVGADAGGGNSGHVAAVFEGYFDGWGFGGKDTPYQSFAF